MALARRCAAAPLVLATALATPFAVGAGTASHFDCHITGSAALDHLGREGQAAELSQFTCRVTGGLLDGFIATGTNIWEPGARHAVLLGSIVVARKGDSAVVYEVQHATRQRVGPGEDTWEGAGQGTYKLATGTAAALAGRGFRTVSRRDGTGRFSIDTMLDE